MIRSSFIFLEGVGPKLERGIWDEGVENWGDFLEKDKVAGISRNRKSYYDRQIRKAEQELYALNSSYFIDVLPFQENWRLYNFFKDETVFLDIETSYRGQITVLGMFDGIETKTMVDGINLEKDILKKELSKYKLIVTFNGASFDLPIIERYFQGTIPKIPHLDLRGACSRIGLKGGLKNIELALNISRPEHLRPIRGEHAVELWRAFKASGDREYLDLLVQYNEEDIINLKPLADFVVRQLWNKARNS